MGPFYELKKNHRMGGYMKGSETKGGERKGSGFHHHGWVLP
jgi:hypothetical protein